MIFGKKKTSSLLSKYLDLYQKRPTSRVFAPLAETYRKLGMLDEAMEVLRRGIKYNPTYVLGYLVLAQCYGDQGKMDLVYSTLQPFASDNRDNVSLQKLFAEACLALGEEEKALETFKFLLFLNPKDEYSKEKILKLEDKVMVQVESIPARVIKEPHSPRPLFDDEDDNWVAMNLAEAPTPKKEIPKMDKVEVIERSLDDDYYSDDPDMDEKNESEPQASEPVISHTLVDLYIAQGVFDIANELLDKILKAYPADKSTQEKKKMVMAKMNKPMDQHQELVHLVSEKVQKPNQEKVQKALKMFLKEIKSTATTKQYG
jgi:tetratricopeptide (TPR) repeat protein